jgi:RNA polymerase sigma-70 factor (ECF subfamily)
MGDTTAPISQVDRPSNPAMPDDLALVSALRASDESAFVSLIGKYHSSMLRLARIYVQDDAAAEEVVQETWVAVLRGLDGFRQQSSLKTWIFHILMNRAKTRATRDARTIPFSALLDPDDPAEPAVEETRFLGPESRWRDHWAQRPASWESIPEERLLSREIRARIGQAISELPANQRVVITLRDVDGLAAEDVSRLLHISDANQRVLLHRARSRVRRVLERYMNGE